jgi:hypothetical protein
MTRLNRITRALEELKAALGEENMKLHKLLVDKTLPLKYEILTGKNWNDEPRVACDPFCSLVVAETTIVGMDNEYLRNHKEWPDGE